MRNHKKTRANAGETLVEVMASVVIFLMMVGILQGAILYSRAALVKSRQMRADNETICEALRTEEKKSNGSSSLRFQAVSADGKTLGNQVFQVNADKAKKEITYTGADGTEKTTTFYYYQPRKTTGSTEPEERAEPTENAGAGGGGS